MRALCMGRKTGGHGTVGNCDECRPREDAANNVLHGVVCGLVAVGGGLIHDHDGCFPQHRPRKAHELPAHHSEKNITHAMEHACLCIHMDAGAVHMQTITQTHPNTSHTLGDKWYSHDPPLTRRQIFTAFTNALVG